MNVLRPLLAFLHASPRPSILLALLATAHRALVLLVLLGMHALVPLPRHTFDRTGATLTSGEWDELGGLRGLVRWDGVHFARVALDGWTKEYELAFGVGQVGLVRGLVNAMGGGGIRSVVLAAVGVSSVSSILAVLLFYHLSLAVLAPRGAPVISNPSRTSALPPRATSSRAERIARTAALLYLLSPSPATLVAGYTEPLCAVLGLAGFVVLARGSGRGWGMRTGLVAALFLAGATAVRPLGVLSAVVYLWPVGEAGVRVVRAWTRGSGGTRWRTLQNLARATATNIPLACIVIAPFLWTQLAAWHDFCLGPESATSSASAHTPWLMQPSPARACLEGWGEGAAPGGWGRRPWCDAGMRSAYVFVQRAYWGSGFLLYWQLKQIPNFALAMPVLVAAGMGAWHGGRVIMARLQEIWNDGDDGVGKKDDGPDNMSSKSTLDTMGATRSTPSPPRSQHPLLPPLYAIHISTTLILVFSSHVQIALRVCTTMPVVWWTVAGWVETALDERSKGLVRREAQSKRLVGEAGQAWTAKSTQSVTKRAERDPRKEDVPPAWTAKAGRRWIVWMALWQLVSVLLWAFWLPPA